MHNTSIPTDHYQEINERDDLVMDADWNLTIAHVRGARQSGFLPEPVSLKEDGVIVFVKITKASIAVDTPCVPGARKVSNQCLRKRWWLKQGGSGSGAINVPNFAKLLETRRNHSTFKKHHDDHQSARSCSRRPSGTSERRLTVSRPERRVYPAHHHWHLFVASQLLHLVNADTL